MLHFRLASADQAGASIQSPWASTQGKRLFMRSRNLTHGKKEEHWGGV
jgi:hypothetical protein